MSSLFSNLSQNKPSGMSAFGGANSNQQTQTNNNALGQSTSSGAQQSGPFALPNSQPQQNPTPSLFPGSGTSQPQQQSGTASLFGSSASTLVPPQQTNTGGILGGSAMAQPLGTQPPNASSMFGAPGGQQQPQSQSAPVGSLGLSGIGNPQQSTQLAPSASQPAYFNHLLERSKKRNHQENGSSQLGDLPSLQLGLGDIARKVRNLGSGEAATLQGRGADSKAHYLLAASGVSTGSALRDLKSFNMQAGIAAPSTSAELPDTDLESYFAKRQAKTTLELIEEGLERSKRDFDAFIEAQVFFDWDEQRRRIYEHFGLLKKDGDPDSGDSRGVAGAFGRSRKSRAVGSNAFSKSASVFGATGLPKSVIGTGAKGPGRGNIFADVSDKAGSNGAHPSSDEFFVRDKQEKLADKVKQLNLARMQENAYPLLGEFGEVEAQAGIDNTVQFVDSYKALIEITGENSGSDSEAGADVIKERQYMQDYLDENLNSHRSMALRKRIIRGSRLFLEKQYYNQLEAAIAKNPREASLGGIPTTINKVRAYIRLCSARKEIATDNVTLQTLENDYCWVLIFYLLRCGFVREAAQYVTENERAFKSMDRNLQAYITCYARDPDRRLPSELQAKVNSEFQSWTRTAPENTVDPYKIACYKVIGRCELSRRSLDGVNQKMEDWVWLQFALAREVNRAEETRAETFNLDDLRSVIAEIGQRHFSQGSDSSGSFGTFFHLQILAGMFEQAIAYLYPHNYVTAVHFAIALNYYGLLRVSDFNVSETELLSYDTKRRPKISFGRMVGYYTRDFRAAKAEAATDYLILICLNADLPGEAGEVQRALCYEALRELVLETREFALLLGDIRSDGKRIKGVIEQRLKLIKLSDQEEFLRTVTIQAASVADESGRTTDAVLLYHLAEEYDNVIDIINRALSEALSVQLGGEQLRLEPLKPRSAEDGQQPRQQQPDSSSLSLTSVDDPAVLARNMISVYNANALYFQKIKQSNRDACGLLLRMHEAKGKVEVGKWAEALDIIQSLNLLPLTAQGNISLIRTAAQNFNTLPPVIASNIGNLLMWTITCCGRQRDVLRASAFEDQTRKQMADELLAAAKDLMVFAGLVKYRLPPRVFEALARAGQDVGAY